MRAEVMVKACIMGLAWRTGLVVCCGEVVVNGREEEQVRSTVLYLDSTTIPLD
jgi:hypothetical protein